MTADETKSTARPLNLPLRKRFRCDRNSLIIFGGYKDMPKFEALRVCLSAACKEIVGSFNISFIQGNFRAIIEGDSRGPSQTISFPPLGTIGGNNRK
ncbi:hypothetical protein CDAR_574841 [Caerostris darwini]|uniref:Uncharacterized protein n=1 Tax=Caerostris darwini TaxID=1538125 RepID=A0AAV4SX40_9ARAC|nr:hypothetical protein CDAR_574841 [Caerostris darwini]